MSVGPLGMLGSAAGSQLAQARGSDVEKAQQDATDQTRRGHATERAEHAAGVSHTQEDQEAADRDADGRRLWEAPPEKQSPPDENAEPESSSRSKDPTGVRGANLDLSG